MVKKKAAAAASTTSPEQQQAEEEDEASTIAPEEARLETEQQQAEEEDEASTTSPEQQEEERREKERVDAGRQGRNVEWVERLEEAMQKDVKQWWPGMRERLEMQPLIRELQATLLEVLGEERIQQMLIFALETERRKSRRAERAWLHATGHGEEAGGHLKVPEQEITDEMIPEFMLFGGVPLIYRLEAERRKRKWLERELEKEPNHED